MDFTRGFSSETAGLLAHKAKPRPQIPQGPVVFPFLLQWLQCQMERNGRCRRVKSSIYGNHRFSRFCDHNNQRAFDQKGFSRLVLLSNSWNVLQLKYRTTGFAYFSRRMNAVSENHDGRDAFKMLN